MGKALLATRLEMMVSEVAFQLESEVGKLFLGLIHNGAFVKGESIGLEAQWLR